MEDPELITLVITFELIKRLRPWYINVTDGQTDGRLTIAIQRFAQGVVSCSSACSGPMVECRNCNREAAHLQATLSKLLKITQPPVLNGTESK